MYMGGAANFSGGGFMPSQSNTLAAVDSGSSWKTASQSTGLFPLTVKQIAKAIQNSADDNLVVDGQDVSNVTLVGMMWSKQERTTDISFILDDGTGRVEVKRWLDSPDAPEALELHNMQQGVYVRVHGHMRTFQNKKHIVAFSVRAITDFNEITCHFLECIFVHAQNIKSQGTLKSPIQPTVTTVSNPGYTSHTNPYVAQTYTGHGDGMNDYQRRVKLMFEEPASLYTLLPFHIVFTVLNPTLTPFMFRCIEQGLHFEEAAKKMVGMSMKQVKDAIEFLVNEGYIYSTIDEDHFKSTNA